MEKIIATFTIGAFADAGGVNVETIRFYQRKGLLTEPEKPLGGIRRYGLEDVTRVRFIKSAQRLGFSLEEIAELLRLEDGAHCQEASSLATRKLMDVRRLQDSGFVAQGESSFRTCRRVQFSQRQCDLPANRVTSGRGLPMLNSNHLIGPHVTH